MSYYLRHAAALALVGWALISPPPTGDGPDLGAPVNEWLVIHRGFATVRQCEDYRDHVQIWFGYANLTERTYSPPKREVEKGSNSPPQFHEGWRCTPDDDPRLKGR
jgi:hypothetical protein